MAFKRPDGRALDQLRPIEAKVGVIKNANGSAMFKCGNSTALAAVYGPRNLHPKFKQDPRTGILRCHYNMMPFSGHGDRIRPGGSRRSKEISMVTEKALLPALSLEDYPNTVVDLFIEFPQTDAGTRCAGICAASLALADAGLTMKDMVAAVAIGRFGNNIFADLTYEEEAMEEDGHETTDLPVAIMPSTGQITLLQMDGLIKREELKKALELASKATQKINEIQKKALKDKYVAEQVDQNE